MRPHHFCRNRISQKEKGATVRKRRSVPSLFQPIDHKNFDRLAENWQIDKGVRSFTTWEMAGVLIQCMTLRLESFPEAAETFGVPRSAFADAMEGRCSGFFQDLCDEILLCICGRTKDRKIKRDIGELLAIDSTECDIHGSLFSKPGWAKKRSDGNTASCKLHVV
jgi:hypothetical protein